MRSCELRKVATRANRGFEKTARLLRPEGAIALVWHLDTSQSVLLTISDVRALPSRDRADFIDAIRMVVRGFGSVVDKYHETVMLVACRV